MEDIRIMRRKEVQAVTGHSRSNIYLLMAKGEFPKQVKLSERSVGWVASEIQEYLQNRIFASR
jgi:prophage regulatory protein